jgi:hypothetical protein
MPVLQLADPPPLSSLYTLGRPTGINFVKFRGPAKGGSMLRIPGETMYTASTPSLRSPRPTTGDWLGIGPLCGLSQRPVSADREHLGRVRAFNPRVDGSSPSRLISKKAPNVLGFLRFWEANAEAARGRYWPSCSRNVNVAA